jgi:hypothetical protein
VESNVPLVVVTNSMLTVLDSAYEQLCIGKAFDNGKPVVGYKSNIHMVKGILSEVPRLKPDAKLFVSVLSGKQAGSELGSWYILVTPIPTKIAHVVASTDAVEVKARETLYLHQYCYGVERGQSAGEIIYTDKVDDLIGHLFYDKQHSKYRCFMTLSNDEFVDLSGYRAYRLIYHSTKCNHRH